MSEHRIYRMIFANIYSLYIAKAERKNRTKTEVDQIISWLTGYSSQQLQEQIDKQVDVASFFAQAPKMNPLRASIRGLVCGVRVEEVSEPLMREIRYLDKLIDELAKGRVMQKILRQEAS